MSEMTDSEKLAWIMGAVEGLVRRIGDLEKEVARSVKVDQPGGVPVAPTWPSGPAIPGLETNRCGRCSMVFETGKAYGYVCGQVGCPMGLGSPVAASGVVPLTVGGEVAPLAVGTPCGTGG